eukprot:scaffold97307_cov19-Tisochrysis_lutea.AAC.2
MYKRCRQDVGVVWGAASSLLVDAKQARIAWGAHMLHARCNMCLVVDYMAGVCTAHEFEHGGMLVVDYMPGVCM